MQKACVSSKVGVFPLCQCKRRYSQFFISKELGLWTTLYLGSLIFLTNILQHVKIIPFVSSAITLSTGVPQVSVLRQIIFSFNTWLQTYTHGSNALLKFEFP
ncbi:hypothetical protein CRENBAI_017655 [Crenichthys baileyi]|uniref:Uncharacterized protein n=1 Tax=Crenichthys baileyi TaxID=28760 RepID=A0AAV9RRD8_9TELE